MCRRARQAGRVAAASEGLPIDNDSDTSTVSRPIVRIGDGAARSTQDVVVAEAPLEIRLETVPLAVLMRTPGHDVELIKGFFITEGIVVGEHEIAEVRVVEGDPEKNRWEVVLAEGVHVDPTRFQRNVYTSSSCGVCGKASIDAVRLTAAPAEPGPVLSYEVLFGLVDRLRVGQATFDDTGGLHAAAVFDASGEMVLLREDIGRHNAVDKVIGALGGAARSRQLVLVVSGRVSFEIVQKAAVAGLPVVCGISAASSLAIELAEELGMTLIGFLRGRTCNVYTGVDRLRP